MFSGPFGFFFIKNIGVIPLLAAQSIFCCVFFILVILDRAISISHSASFLSLSMLDVSPLNILLFLSFQMVYMAIFRVALEARFLMDGPAKDNFRKLDMVSKLPHCS
uniref:Uncharacterized protein n=1 Tax=Kalanchoe fedtschenkoi TaxID=63787 RepID=A0A7N0U4V7_KALFE